MPPRPCLLSPVGPRLAWQRLECTGTSGPGSELLQGQEKDTPASGGVDVGSAGGWALLVFMAINAS